MDLTTLTAAEALSEILTDPGAALGGTENGLGVDITNRIVDSGSNSDGEWIKFANGTMICHRSRYSMPNDNSGFVQATLQFPQSFSSSTPSAIAVHSGGSGSGYSDITNVVAIADATSITLSFRSHTSSISSGRVYQADYIVIGQWN